MTGVEQMVVLLALITVGALCFLMWIVSHVEVNSPDRKQAVEKAIENPSYEPPSPLWATKERRRRRRKPGIVFKRRIKQRRLRRVEQEEK